MTTLYDSIYNFMVAHPVLALVLWTLFLGAFNAYVGSLDAPTKDSSQAYKSYFAVMNSLAFSFSRLNPKVENSPNWQAALDKEKEQVG